MNREDAPSVMVISGFQYVQKSVAAALTGYSVKAQQRKIEEGVWREGHEWIKGPDGLQLISVEGYNKWVESARA